MNNGIAALHQEVKDLKAQNAALQDEVALLQQKLRESEQEKMAKEVAKGML